MGFIIQYMHGWEGGLTLIYTYQEPIFAIAIMINNHHPVCSTLVRSTSCTTTLHYLYI